MDRTQAESLFQLAVTLRIAYPHRSSYDRRSSLTVAAAIENGERLMAAAPGPRGLMEPRMTPWFVCAKAGPAGARTAPGTRVMARSGSRKK